jgi:diguanylate cyclase (GGDEF)-like protein/PAS domain S-box-containing protein
VPHLAESVLEAAGVGGWELEVAAGALRWTAVTYRIHDVDPTFQPTVEAALGFYAPQARPIIEAAVTETIRAGTPFDLELPMLTARGRPIWVRVVGRATRENGVTTKVCGAFEDITAGHELAAREARLSVLARQMNNVVLMLDRSGRTEWANDAFTRSTGWTFEDIRGRWPGELLIGPRTDPASVEQIADCIRQGTGFAVELWNYNKDGSARLKAVVGTPMLDTAGEISGFISVETDVTEQRAAEAQARGEAAERARVQDLLRDVLDTLPNGITAYDADGRFLLCNRAYGEMQPISARFLQPGRSQEDVLRLAAEHGQYAEAPTDPAAREAWVSERIGAFRTGESLTTRLADGRMMHSVVRRSESGVLVTVRTDTTELHLAEQTARREANERARAEALLRDVLDTLPSAVTAYDSDDRFLLANRAAAELFPITTKFAVPGRKRAETMRLAAEAGQYPDAPTDPAERDAWIAKRVSEVPDGQPRDIRLPDGRVLQVRERRSETGTLVSVRSDTTNLHRAEEKARREAADRERAETLLRDVLDTLPTGVNAYDADGHFILANRAYAEMLPITASFMVPGRRYEEVIRLALQAGQYADAPTDPAAREAWIAERLHKTYRADESRILRLANGRIIQVRVRRSATGTVVSVGHDTTELHIAEEKARREAAERERAETLLRDVLDSLPNVVTAYDAEERFVFANRVFRELYPIASRFAIPGRRREESFRMAAEHGQYGDLPTEPEERERWFAEQMAKWRSGADRIVRLQSGRILQVREGRSSSGINVSVATDTTDLYNAEEAARREAAERQRAEALLRDVLDTLPTGVIAYDHEDRVVLVNRVYADLFPISARIAAPGRSIDEVLRQSAREGQYAEIPTDPEAFEQWLAQTLEYHRSGEERTIKLPDGRRIQIRGRRSATGNLVSVRTDITELTRAQALLRDILDTLPTAVSAFDAEDRLILENRAVKEMFPITSQFTAIGRTRRDTLRMAAQHGQYTDAPGEPAELEAWILRRLQDVQDGTPRTVRLADNRVVQVRERRSETGTLVIVRTDITDQTRAQELLRDVLDTLPHAVIAFDRDDRLILTNRAYAELFPIAARYVELGRGMEEGFRLSAANGQYVDMPTEPEAFERWVAGALDILRTGTQRILQLRDGRTVQMQGRRSDSGTLVSVRTDISDLARAEALLRDILEALPSGVIAFDREERMVLWNSAAMEIYPHTAQIATVGRTLEEVVRFEAEQDRLGAVEGTSLAQEEWITRQLATYRAGNGERTLQFWKGRFAQARERRSDSGNLVCIRTETTDLVRAQALLRDVLDALPSAVAAHDAEERLILINRAYAEILPIAARFFTLGSRLEDSLRLAAEAGQFLDAGATAETRAAWIHDGLASYRNPGPPRTLALPEGRYVQARESRSDTGVIVSIRTDTTELTRAEQTMRFQAERDPLTGLANRTAFLAALDLALQQPHRLDAGGGALLLLDVDYFKQINDTLGHDNGDALLVEIAARLRTHLRASDVPARLGGDEFGVVMPGLHNPPALTERLDTIHAALSAPVQLAGRRLQIGVSVGVTSFPADGTQAPVLLKNADLALYEAKRNGRGRWSAFRPEQAQALDHQNRLADALRDALAREQISVAFQPKRWLRAGGGHAGFEALARWHDGNRWVPPSEFIPVAEDTGLIGQLGRGVMAASLARVREIRDLGLDPGRVAVNVTAQQLLDAHFKDETLAMLRRFGLRPADLELEITETVLLGRAAERIDGVLRGFSDLGITLALDDFGTGYASLAHLSRLPIDRLKIDRSFVNDISGGGPGGVITRTVISLARSLEMESIAEGVETQEQCAFLQAAGCDAGQGYLFAKPLLTTAEAVAYLRTVDEPPDGQKIDIARITLH